MKEFGAEFNQSIHLKYTKINLYSKEPKKLGNYSSIFETHGNEKTRDKIFKFYSNFQKEKNFFVTLEHLLRSIIELLVDDSFYLFYNDIYWQLPMTHPYISLTYEEVPLP